MRNNYMLAQFMGFGKTDFHDGKGLVNTYTDHEGSPHTIHELLFDESWDWIMEVVKKYNRLQDEGVDKVRGQTGWSHRIEQGLLDVEIDEVYYGLIDFVNWYNLRIELESK
jgi:hypothetical protein